MSPEICSAVTLELGQLERLLKCFAPLRLKVITTPPDLIETAALAGFLHSFYNGIENIFKRIAVHLDQARPRGELWHRELLTSMAQPTAQRTAVISRELVSGLKAYLDFRHVFRHAYSFELQWSKMAPLVADSESVFAQLKVELERWLRSHGA